MLDASLYYFLSRLPEQEAVASADDPLQAAAGHDNAADEGVDVQDPDAAAQDSAATEDVAQAQHKLAGERKNANLFMQVTSR